MTRILRHALHVFLYAAFAAIIGLFSHWPVYQRLPDDAAVLKLSFNQNGQRLADCRALAPEQLAALPPSERVAATRCARERSPIRVQLRIDGQLRLDETAAPAGLSRDGTSSLYRKFVLAAGAHEIDVRISDDLRQPGFTHEATRTFVLQPAEVLVVDFDPAAGGILFQ